MANFQQNPGCTLTLQASPATGGTVGFTSGAATGSCSRQVTVQATPNNGWVFTEWSDGNISATRTFVVNGDITLIANFVSISSVLSRLADFLLGQGSMSALERTLVDQLGNRNADVDLGDLLKIIDRNPGLAFSPELVRKLDSLGVKVERTRDTTTPRMERR